MSFFRFAILSACFGLAVSAAHAASFNIELVAEVDTSDPAAPLLIPTFGDPAVSGEGLLTFDLLMTIPDGKTIAELTADPDPDFGGDGDIRWTVGGAEQVFEVARFARVGVSLTGYTFQILSSRSGGTSLGEADNFSFFIDLKETNMFTSQTILADEFTTRASLLFPRAAVRTSSGTGSGPLFDLSSQITNAVTPPAAPIPLPAGLPLLIGGLAALAMSKRVRRRV